MDEICKEQPEVFWLPLPTKVKKRVHQDRKALPADLPTRLLSTSWVEHYKLTNVSKNDAVLCGGYPDGGIDVLKPMGTKHSGHVVLRCRSPEQGGWWHTSHIWSSTATGTLHTFTCSSYTTHFKYSITPTHITNAHAQLTQAPLA